MAQTLLAYLLVALAAGWLAWSMLLPKAARRVLKARLAGQGGAVSGRGGCACGDGGCGG
ncbi:MAG TPA: hypothetical protein VL358_15000 [Caulobacteraceae bacterium]|jgi:hypothetical protein|nr:hypothetical protein [Caulobacteraceae bacterium]